MKSNEIALLKSASFTIGTGDAQKIGIVAFHYHSEKGEDGKSVKAKSFYRCDLAIKTKAQWEEIAATLKQTPDTIFNPATIGMTFPAGLDAIYYAKDAMTNAKYAKFIENKIKKATTFDAFKAEAFEGKEPFGKVYKSGDTLVLEDLSDETKVAAVSTTDWVLWEKPKAERKPRDRKTVKKVEVNETTGEVSVTGPGTTEEQGPETAPAAEAPAPQSDEQEQAPTTDSGVYVAPEALN